MVIIWERGGTVEWCREGKVVKREKGGSESISLKRCEEV